MHPAAHREDLHSEFRHQALEVLERRFVPLQVVEALVQLGQFVAGQVPVGQAQ